MHFVLVTTLEYKNAGLVILLMAYRFLEFNSMRPGSFYPSGWHPYLNMIKIDVGGWWCCGPPMELISIEQNQPNHLKTGIYIRLLCLACDFTPYSWRKQDYSQNHTPGTKYSSCSGVRNSFDHVISHIQRIQDGPVKKHNSCYFDFTGREHIYGINPTLHSRSLPFI